MNENKKFYVAVVAFLAIIFVLSYFVIQSGQQDTYTVLYFSDPIEPLVYNAPEKTLTVNFTIENHENQDLKYTYAIKLGDSGVVEQDITLKEDETAVILEDIDVGEVRGNMKVSVQLYKEGFDEIYRQIWHEVTI